MRRFLQLWICLAPPLVVTTLAVSVIGFRHLDLRFVTFVHALLIPTFQAAVVTWVEGRWGLSRLVWAARETVNRRLIAGLVVLDASFLCLGVAMREHTVLGVIGNSSLHLRWAAVKTLLAGALLVATAVSWRQGGSARIWVVSLAGLAIAVASGAFVPWLKDLPELIQGAGPVVVRWILVYGGLSVLALMVLSHVAARVHRGSPLAAFYVDVVSACAFLVTVICAVNIFLRPFLAQPWIGVVTVLASTGATALLVASTLLYSVRGDKGNTTR